jgi:F-type H+-transporting ATPase subunit delta
VIGRIARPYAQATWSAAGSAEAASAILGELRTLQAAWSQFPELGRATTNPAVPMEVKERILASLAAKLGLGEITQRLASRLLRNYRLGRVGEIADGLEILLRRATGTVAAQVTTAAPISAAEQQALAAALGKAVGRRVDVSTTTDPAILAGFVARVGSTVYDASLKRRLERLSDRLVRA